MAKARLRSAQIYQAMVDDEAFALLPTLLAQSVGARSCVIHWRDVQHHAEVMAHSDYYSPEQMLNYAENFVEHDEWSHGGQQRRFINRVWNTKEVVAPGVYEGSIFYNEWIRAMGDDTYHCIGSVMETDRGLGLIGLHRGKSQADFDDQAIAELNRNILHLRRMLTVRARLATDPTRLRGVVALLDNNPSPMLAVTPRGRIVHANAAAEALLQAGKMIRHAGDMLHAAIPAAEPALALAIARAADPISPVASAVTISAAHGQILELTLAPLSDRGAGLVLVTARDPDAQLRQALMPRDAQDVLAPRELAVARLVGLGLRNREIAERLGVTEGTVKAYLHNLFAKVGVATRTQLAVRMGLAPPP